MKLPEFIKTLLPRTHSSTNDVDLPTGTSKSNLSNADEPQPRRINKIFLFILIGFISVVFIYTFQDSFDQSDRNSKKKTEQKSQKDNVKSSSPFETLPNNYDNKKSASSNENPADALNPGTQRLPTNSNLTPPIPPAIPSYEQTAKNTAINQRLNEIKKFEEELEAAFKSKIGVLSTGANSSTGSSANSLVQTSNSEQQLPDQNRQADKSSFLNNSKLPNLLNAQVIIPPLSEYTISAGGNIPCALITGINTDLPGSITAQVTENVYDTASGQYLLIPQGTKLIGKYDSVVTYGQYRILLVWQRLMLPNGKSILLENMQGMDNQGYAGIRDGVDKHTPDLVRGVVLSALLSATSMAATSTHNSNTDYRSSAGQGAAQAVLDVGSQITRKNLERQPTLTVKPGTLFMVMVHQDLVLEPFSN